MSPIRKNNSPSPHSYKTEKALDVTSKFHGNIQYKMGKEKKELFIDKTQKIAKIKPGVGKYNCHLALDKVYRPSTRSRMN